MLLGKTHRNNKFCSMEKLYYLREGDFLPEPIESICDSWHRCRTNMIIFLSKNNNLFTSKEEAMRASCAIRSVLSAITAHQGQQAPL